jgi:predicted metal-dependent HD superfamily phosphohydrolase
MTKTTTTSIVSEAEDFVKAIFAENLTGDHRYHNLPHTLAVRKACLAIGKRLEISKENKEVLELACLFHDTGFVETYEGHEAASHRIASEFLEQRNYPEARKEKVLDCIDVTFPPNQPTTLLEKIIRDADLASLGSASYPEQLAALRHEWEVFLGQTFPESDWFRLNRDFMERTRYYTTPAEEMWGANKLSNEKYLKRMAKHVKKKSQKKEEKPPSIQGNRSAQMMFKTSLRNHLDLSSLADNKANIMLSVNALILTIAAPLALSYIQDNILLIIPLIMLLITCLASMIFATLATRPIKMTGYTGPEQIDAGRSNLFFFGNFYAMSFEEYSEGMQKVISDENKLESAIRRDLYYLGYNIFMAGMITTIITMIITYSISVTM